MIAPESEQRFPFARVSNVALLFAAASAALAIRRFVTFHNETFDLAFYTRLVWGLGHGDRYQPLTNSDVWGLHASPILWPLALVGRAFPIVPMLLVVQAAAVAAAGIPLARIAARRVGHPGAADVALIAYLLYPTIATITTYEFHPGTLALFPLALALEYFDRRAVRPGIIALAIAALCREDAALVAGFTGLALALRREHRAVGLAVFVAGTAWFAVYLFAIAPHYLPHAGSLQLHYGHLGGSPGAIARALFAHPIAAITPLVTPARLLYAPRLLVPVAFLSLLAPRWCLPALVPIAINSLSQFPAAVQIPSHYAALAVPFLFASAAHGAGRLAAERDGAMNRYVALAGVAVALGTLHMQHRAGATPLSVRWRTSAFQRDARSVEVPALLRHIPSDAGVIAPDYVLPHVAARPLIGRVPWTRPLDWVLLSLEYRSRFEGTQDLWRSSEEVLLRNTLARGVYGVYARQGQHVLLRFHWPARAYAEGRYVVVEPTPGVHAQHLDVGASLTLAGWGIRAAPGGSVITVLLVARRPWPADLGFELGWGAMHAAGDRLDPARIIAALPFDGVFSPVSVHVGEVVRSEIALPVPPDQLAGVPLYFGARRIDGSRLDPESAHWTRLL